MKDPGGFLVLHRTRLDEDGRLALSRLDENFKTQWTAPLPLCPSTSCVTAETPRVCSSLGIVQQTVQGGTSASEHLVALNLADGKTQSWNIPAEKMD